MEKLAIHLKVGMHEIGTDWWQISLNQKKYNIKKNTNQIKDNRQVNTSLILQVQDDFKRTFTIPFLLEKQCLRVEIKVIILFTE